MLAKCVVAAAKIQKRLGQAVRASHDPQEDLHGPGVVPLATCFDCLLEKRSAVFRPEPLRGVPPVPGRFEKRPGCSAPFPEYTTRTTRFIRELLYKCRSLQYTLRMQEVQNLAQITRNQVILADKLAIGVRLGAGGIVLVLCLATGLTTPSIAAGSTFFALGIYALVAGALLARKRDPTALFIPSLVLDCLAVMATGLVAVASMPFLSALPVLIVLEGYCSGIVLLSTLRLSTREVILAGSSSSRTPSPT